MQLFKEQVKWDMVRWLDGQVEHGGKMEDFATTYAQHPLQWPEPGELTDLVPQEMRDAYKEACNT